MNSATLLLCSVFFAVTKCQSQLDSLLPVNGIRPKSNNLRTSNQERISWGSWSGWSTCSSSTEPGYEVRTRSCFQKSCAGDDIQAKPCNLDSEQLQLPRRKFVEECQTNPQAQQTLSCLLYLEDPQLAYTLFRQNSCFFNNDDNGTRRNQLRSNEILSWRTTSDKQTITKPETLSNQNMVVEKICSDMCNLALVQSTKVKTIKSDVATFLDIVKLLRVRTNVRANIAAIFSEYTKCLQYCYMYGSSYFSARQYLLSTGTDPALNNPALQITKIKKMAMKTDPVLNETRTDEEIEENLQEIAQTLVRRKREAVTYEPANNETPESTDRPHKELKAMLEDFAKSKCKGETKCGNINPSYENKPQNKRNRLMLERIRTVIRNKRQAPPEVTTVYKSPCSSAKEEAREYFDADGNKLGELYFFEENKQRFIRRKCTGIPVANTNNLYFPQLTIQAISTGEIAKCQQGFLTRYALIIEETPDGEYRLPKSNRRFTIKATNFELESHCEITLPTKQKVPSAKPIVNPQPAKLKNT